MKNIFLFLLFQLVPLHYLNAQIFQSLSPQTNCSNSFFVDYVAIGKLNENKTQLNVSGLLITSSDSIADISFYVEKSSILTEKNNQFYKEICDIKIYSASLNGVTKNIYFEQKKQDLVLKIRSNILTKKNNLIIVFNLPNIFKKEIEFVLACEVTFKNGCRYIKKQKIILQ